MIKKIAFAISFVLMIGLLGWVMEIPEVGITEWLVFLWMFIGVLIVMYYTVE